LESSRETNKQTKKKKTNKKIMKTLTVFVFLLLIFLVHNVTCDSLFGHELLRNSGEHRAHLAAALNGRRARDAFGGGNAMPEIEYSHAHKIADPLDGSHKVRFELVAATVRAGTVHLDDAVALLRPDNNVHDVARCNMTHVVFAGDHLLARQIASLLGEHGALTSATLRCNDATAGRRGRVGTPLLARLIAPYQSGAEHLVVEALESPFELLLRGSLHFESTRLPRVASFKRKRFVSSAPLVHHPVPRNDKRGIVEFFSAIGQFFLDIVRETVDALEKLADAMGVLFEVLDEVGTYIATGELDATIYGALYEADWNYNSGSNSAIRATFVPPAAASAVTCGNQSNPMCVSCRNCFFQMDLGLLFKWNITQYTTLHDFALLLRGDVAASMNIVANGGARVSGDVPLFRDILLPEIEIKVMIGPVPIFVSFTLDLALGLRGSLALPPGAAPLNANVSLAACAEYGLELNRDTGSVEPVTRVEFSPSVSPLLERGGAAQLTVDAVLGAYLTARTFVKLQKIGGPFVQLQPSIEVAVDGRAQCASLNWGADVGIGGFLSIKLGRSDIELFSREWPAHSVLQQKASIVTTCPVARTRQATLQAASPIVGGRTWIGDQAACIVRVNDTGDQPFYAVQLSMQAFESPNASDSFLVGVNYAGRFGGIENPLILVGMDRDEDGVNDFALVGGSVVVKDLCSFTFAKVSRVGIDRINLGAALKTVDANGCAPDQLPDSQDPDRDGIGADDRCPQTPSGWRATVNRNATSTEYGCSICDIDASQCAAGLDGAGASVIGIECAMSAVYRAVRVRGTPAHEWLFDFTRVTDDLGLDGKRARGLRLLTTLVNPGTVSNSASRELLRDCFRTDGTLAGCPCHPTRSRCFNGPECNSTLIFAGGLRGACLAQPGADGPCKIGAPGCACFANATCADSFSECQRGFCLVVAVPFVSASNMEGSLSVVDVSTDSSFSRRCSAFSKHVDLVPIERFRGKFTGNMFSTSAVLSADEVSSLTNVNRSCPTWRMTANDPTRSIATLDAGDQTRKRAEQCKYSRVVPNLRISDFKPLSEAAELINVLGEKVGKTAKAKNLGFVKNTFDYDGVKALPMGSLPNDNGGPGIDAPQPSKFGFRSSSNVIQVHANFMLLLLVLVVVAQ
jgi:hypothetical protein